MNTKQKISPTLNRQKDRQKNSEERERQLEDMNSNDMMSAKSIVVFLASLFKGIKRDIKTEDEILKLMIEKTNEKLKISDEEAIKFIQSREFEKLNKQLEKPFTEDEKKQFVAYIQMKEVQQLTPEVINKLQEQSLEIDKNKRFEQTKSNIEKATNSKIHRQLNTNRK